VEFVFNPKTPDETKVLSHVIMVNSEDADTLLGMSGSVLGKFGLTINPYKCRVKYYVNWREPNARKAYLKSTFLVDRPSPAFAASECSRCAVQGTYCAGRFARSVRAPTHHVPADQQSASGIAFPPSRAVRALESGSANTADTCGHTSPLKLHHKPPYLLADA
jgi:hypothetical protein